MTIPDNSQETPAAASHQVIVKGKPGHAVFPEICVACASPAITRVERAEVFSHSDSEGGIVYEVLTIHVPLCGACHEQHLREKPRRGLLWRIGLLFHSWGVLALIGALGTTLFFAYQGVSTPMNRLFGLHAPWWFSLFFGAISLLILRGTWKNTDHLAAPDPSSVTQAVGFGENEAGLFQRRRHTFYFRNSYVADSFAALNAERVVNKKQT